MAINDHTYGPRMVFDSFFNAPDIPQEKIGGWYVRGHDSNDVYQEFIIYSPNPPNREIFPHVEGWIDWIRVPIEIGNPLLVRDDGNGH